MSSRLVSTNNKTTLSNVTHATANGNFKTSSCTNAQLTMPEFSNKNNLDIKFNIMDKHSLPHDVMLGKDASSDLNMKLD